MQPQEQFWFTPQEAAVYLRLSVETLAQWRVLGRGPIFTRRVHPGGKKPIIRYRKANLDAWLAGDAQQAA